MHTHNTKTVVPVRKKNCVHKYFSGIEERHCSCMGFSRIQKSVHVATLCKSSSLKEIESSPEFI